MIRLPSPGRAMVCLAALAAFVSWALSDRLPAGQAGVELRQPKAIRLGSALWRIGDCNWLAYAADGKTVYACCATHRPGVQLGYSATDIIRQVDVRTGRQVQQFALPKVPDEPDIPGALDKRIAAVGWPCQLVAFFATWPEQTTVYVWDMARDQLLYGIPNGGYHVALSPHGKFLARQESRTPYRIHVADARTGRERWQLDPHVNGKFVDADSPLIAFSPNDKLLAFAFAGGSQLDGLTVWDLTTGKEVLRNVLPRATIGVSPLFAPDSNTLGLRIGNKYSLWDIRLGRETMALPGWQWGRKVFSPDGKTLASTSGGLSLWHVGGAQQWRRLPGRPASPITAVAFSPDGREIAAIAGSVLRRWDVATGRAVPVPAIDTGRLLPVIFRADGSQLVTLPQQGVASLWNTESGANVWRQPDNSGDAEDGLAVSPDGRIMATFRAEHKAVWLSDARTGRRLRCLMAGLKDDPKRYNGNDRSRLIFTDDGASLLCLPSTDELAQPNTGYVIPLAGAAKPRSFRVPGYVQNDPRQPSDYIVETVYAPNGRWYAMGNWALINYDSAHPLVPAPDVRIGTLRPVEQVTTFPVPRDPAKNVFYVRSAFAPDGRTLAVLAMQVGPPRILDPTVTAYLVETATGHARARLELKTFGFGQRDGVLVTDGRFLAYADTNHFRDSPIRVWDFATGRQVARCQTEANVSSLALTLGARTLAAGMTDGAAMVWHLPVRKQRAATLSAQELTQAWDALAGRNAHRAFVAMCRLTADPDGAVTLLRQHLRPVAPPKTDSVQQLITALDSDDFATREKASQALAKLGPAATSALRRVLATNPSPEARRRLTELLKGSALQRPSGDTLQALRAVELLERIGSPAARQILETLAGGDAASLVTTEAQASLIRQRGRVLRVGR